MLKALSKIHTGGRVIIPSSIREALHLGIGDNVLLIMENDELKLISQAEAVRRAQALIAKHIPESVSLVDELIAERRVEAAREAAERETDTQKESIE